MSYKRQKTQFEETKLASEPDSDMPGMLEISDQEYIKTMTNILRTVLEKVDKIREHMGNVSRELEILKKNQKEMLMIKNNNTVTEMKNALIGLIVDWI